MKITEKKTEMIGVKITPTVKQELQKIATKEDRSISYIVNKIIENYLKEKGSL